MFLAWKPKTLSDLVEQCQKWWSLSLCRKSLQPIAHYENSHHHTILNYVEKDFLMVLASAFGALLLFNSIYKYGYTNTHIYDIIYTYYFISYVYMCIYIGTSFSAGPEWGFLGSSHQSHKGGAIWRGTWCFSNVSGEGEFPESPKQSVMPRNNQLKMKVKYLHICELLKYVVWKYSIQIPTEDIAKFRGCVSLLVGKK